MIKELNLNTVLSKVMIQLDKQIDSFIQARTNRGEKAQKKDFFQEVMKGKIEFPITEDVYYNFNRTLNIKSKYNAKTVDLSDFYKICQYTNVSADYYLGLKDTKRDEPSAQLVSQDFGLSDDSMETLRKLHDYEPTYMGELSTELINLVLENHSFWNRFSAQLAEYISCIYDYRSGEREQLITKYGLLYIFEELIDDICGQYKLTKLEKVELDKTDVFMSPDLIVEI